MDIDNDPLYVQLCLTLAQEEARAKAEWFWPEAQVWGARATDAGARTGRHVGDGSDALPKT